MRAAFVEEFGYACVRPGMYGGEMFLRGRLQDLRFIDGAADGDWNAIIDILGVRQLATQSTADLIRSKLTGALKRCVPETLILTNEAASVYAEVGWRLGYVGITRALSPGEWRALRAALPGFREADARASEIEARLGPPSWRGRDILCYAPAAVPALAAARWVSFDCAVDPAAHRAWLTGLAERDDAESARRRAAMRADDPPLRDVRWWVPSGMRVRLTPHGRRSLAWLASNAEA